MKHLIKSLTLILFSVLTLAACSNDDEITTNGSAIMSTGSVKVDGNECCQLKSAFSDGGVADPSRGSSFILELYKDNYAKCPSWELCEVLIEGFEYNDKTYGNLTEEVERIVIKNLPNIGQLNVNLNQGKYEGTNEKVESVDVQKLEFPAVDEKGNMKKPGNVSLAIKIKDGTVIRVNYSGTIQWNGRY